MAARYAGNGKVSTDPFPGSIEITEEQYTQAIDGICLGMAVSIDDGFSVAFPPPAAEKKPTLDQLRAATLARRDSLLGMAALRMAPLQYAVDLGDVTAAEEAAMLAWKRYCVDLNRIEQQEAFPAMIEWPVSPDVL